MAAPNRDRPAKCLTAAQALAAMKQMEASQPRIEIVVAIFREDGAYLGRRKYVIRE